MGEGTIYWTNLSAGLEGPLNPRVEATSDGSVSLAGMSDLLKLHTATMHMPLVDGLVGFYKLCKASLSPSNPVKLQASSGHPRNTQIQLLPKRRQCWKHWEYTLATALCSPGNRISQLPETLR